MKHASYVLVITFVVLASVVLFAGCAKQAASSNKGVAADSFPGFPTGKYIGTVTIEHLDKCEEFAWGKLNDPPGRSSTDVFLTVEPQSTVLKIESDEGNTKSADWFETDKNTLTVTSNHLIGGGKDKKTLYTFDITFTYDAAAKEYAGTGTWGYHDNCEKDYPVVVTLRPRLD